MVRHSTLLLRQFRHSLHKLPIPSLHQLTHPLHHIRWHSMCVAFICYLILNGYIIERYHNYNQNDTITYKRYDGTNFEMRFSKTIKRVDPFGYKFVLRDANKCERDVSSMVICVKSYVRNFEARQTIRATFGRKSFLSGQRMAMVFFVGISDQPDDEEKLIQESDKHGDIIQENYDDRYRSDSYKIVTMLKWLRVHCPLAEYISIIEDDVFVNLRNIYKYKYTLKKTFINNPLFIACFVMNAKKVNRMSNAKYLSTRDFTFDEFPKRCNSAAIFTNNQTILALNEASFNSEYIWSHDIYLSSVLGQKIGAVLVNRTHPLVFKQLTSSETVESVYRDNISKVIQKTTNKMTLKVIWKGRTQKVTRKVNHVVTQEYMFVYHLNTDEMHNIWGLYKKRLI